MNEKLIIMKNIIKMRGKIYIKKRGGKKRGGLGKRPRDSEIFFFFFIFIFMYIGELLLNLEKKK